MNANTETWPRPHRITVDEYYRMAEVGLLTPGVRVELIEGEIIDMAPIGSRHAGVVDKLARLFIQATQGRAIVGIQRPLRLGERSEPQPDILLLEPREDYYTGQHPGAEDVLLAVEVSDTTLRYDLDVKVPLYARHGIPETWVVDLPARRVHFFRLPATEGYAANFSTDEPGVVQIVTLADLCVDFSDLLRF